MIAKFFNSLKDLGRPYRLLFTAGVLSDVGGFTTHTALILHIYKLTGQNTSAMGWAAISSIIPYIIGSLVGGVWAEKYNRKWVMVFNDIIRIPLVLMIMGTADVTTILLLNSLINVFGGIFNPSRQAIIPDLVKPEQIHLANSLNGGIISLVHVLGPVLGGFIYAKTHSMMWIVVLDASTYAASALLLFWMPYVRNPSHGLKKSAMLDDIVAGFFYVRRQKDLFYVLCLMITAGTAIGLLVPLLRPFATERLGGDDQTYTWMIGSFGVGGLLGPFVGYWVGGKLGLGRTILIGFVIETTLFITWSITPYQSLSCFILFLWGMDVFMIIPCNMSYIHTYAEEEYMGRTFSLFDQAIFMPQIFGAAIIAIIGDKLPTQILLMSAGIFYFLVVVLTMRSQGAKLMRSRRGEESTKDPHEVESAEKSPRAIKLKSPSTSA